MQPSGVLFKRWCYCQTEIVHFLVAITRPLTTTILVGGQSKFRFDCWIQHKKSYKLTQKSEHQTLSQICFGFIFVLKRAFSFFASQKHCLSAHKELIVSILTETFTSISLPDCWPWTWSDLRKWGRSVARLTASWTASRRSRSSD